MTIADRHPLVSVIVRSMDRPHLLDALASLARQTCRSLEILVVDATGGRHRPLPDLALREGHTLRLVASERPLPRPHAANAGIDAARGEFLSFLDDDDTCEPEHLQALLDVAQASPDCLVVYGRTRVLAADGSLLRTIGGPFNRALMHCGPLFFWQAALIRTRVRDLGCRVDETLDICEDRDFLAQIARHSDFIFVPVETLHYRPDTGTSGTGRGGNRDDGRRLQFDALLRARWKGPAAYHVERVTRWCRRAVQAYLRGERDLARREFLHALAEYPGDPNALHGLARLQLDDGALDDARRSIDAAIAVDGGTAEHHLVRAWVLERQGDPVGADEAVAHSAHDPLLAGEVAALRARLALNARVGLFAPPGGRLAPCACGSGRRYKDCCGQLQAVAAQMQAVPTPTTTAAPPRVVAAALRDFNRGEASAATRVLDAIAPDDVPDAASSSAVARAYAALARYDRAVAFQQRAVALTEDVAPRRLLDRYCEALYQAPAAASAYEMARALLGSADHRRHVSNSRPRIAIVTSFAQLGGTETRALALGDLLAPHADVTLWSVAPVHPAHAARAAIRVIDAANDAAPDGGTLVLVGAFYDPGDWLHRATFARVVVCYNVELPGELVQRLTHIRDSCGDVAVELTFPTARFQARAGLPGRVELSPLPLARFVPSAKSAAPDASLVIGRHSRDDPDKHHPNDPSLYRRLVQRGHRLRIQGGLPLAAAFAGDPLRGRVELMPAGTEPAPTFLATLDCFLYRKSPAWYEVGGTVILEAMAMGLPVVVFDDGIGGVEWIVDGESGFVVRSEDHALVVIGRLAKDAALRLRVGNAARQRVAQLIDGDREDTLAFYLGDAEPDGARSSSLRHAGIAARQATEPDGRLQPP